jgi:hypothetical protein
MHTWDVRLIATVVSALQLCALVLFYTVQQAPDTSISVTLSCDETSCVLFTCALSLFICLQLLCVTIYLLIEERGIVLVLISSWAFALLLRYPAGTQLHDAFAGVFLGSYLLVLLLQQFLLLHKSAASAVLWVTAVCLLIVWLFTKNHTLQWVAWGFITLVECVLNTHILMIESTMVF